MVTDSLSGSCTPLLARAGSLDIQTEVRTLIRSMVGEVQRPVVNKNPRVIATEDLFELVRDKQEGLLKYANQMKARI